MNPIAVKPTAMKLGYVILYVPDVTAAIVFYDRAFGLTRRFIHEDGGYAELDTGTTTLAFVDEKFIATQVGAFTLARPNMPSAAYEVGLVSDDVSASFDQAVGAGATAVLPPTLKPWGQTVSYVRDINGVLVEICSTVSP